MDPSLVNAGQLLQAYYTEKSCEQRKLLEMRIVEMQRSPLSLLACHQWLTSQDKNLQFLACQTLLFNAREGWDSEMMQRLRVDLGSFLSSLLLHDLPPSLSLSLPPSRSLSPSPSLPSSHSLSGAVRRKLTQAFAHFVINSYPERDLVKECVEAVAVDVLIEIPSELDRLPSLSSAQYNFKHRLGQSSEKVLNLLIVALKETEASPDALECFGAWLTFKSFRTKALDQLIPLLLDRLVNDDDARRRVAINEAMISWLESGIEDLPLERILPNFSRLVPLMQSLFASGREEAMEELQGICKMVRLYADLISPLVVHNEGGSEFLEMIKSLTAIEAQLSSSPVAEISLFWPSFWEDNMVESLIPLIRSICEQVITSIISSLLSPQSSTPERLEYLGSLAPLFNAAYRVHKDWTSQLLIYLTSSDAAQQRDMGLEIFSAIAETVNVEDHEWKDVVTPLASIRPSDEHSMAFFKVMIAASDLIKKTAHWKTIFLFCLQTLQANSPRTAQALKAISVLQGPSVDHYVLENFDSIWSVLADAQRVEFWNVLCRAVNSQKHASLDFLLQVPAGHLFKAREQGLEPSAQTVQMLSIAIKEVERITLEAVYPILESAAVTTSHPRDGHLFTAWNQLWGTVIEKYGATLPNLVLQLLSPSVPRILASRNDLLLRILEAAIVMSPRETALPLAEQINSSLLSLPADEEHWTVLLPILSKSIKHVAPIPTTLLTPGTVLLQLLDVGNSFSDGFLRSACKYFELVSAPTEGGPMSPLDRMALFERILAVALNKLLESQVDIVAQLLLALLQTDPVTLGRKLQIYGTSPALSEIAKKMVACRMPRLFARLLLQLVQNRHHK